MISSFHLGLRPDDKIHSIYEDESQNSKISSAIRVIL